MIRILIALALLTIAPHLAHAATVIACQDSSGSDWVASPAHPCPVSGTLAVTGTTTSTPPNTAGTIAGATVGVASAQVLAASTATTHVGLQNVSAADIWCAWGGAAVIGNSGSFHLFAGQGRDYGPGIGWVPNAALNCIASAASSPLYVEYN